MSYKKQKRKQLQELSYKIIRARWQALQQGHSLKAFFHSVKQAGVFALLTLFKNKKLFIDGSSTNEKLIETAIPAQMNDSPYSICFIPGEESGDLIELVKHALHSSDKALVLFLLGNTICDEKSVQALLRSLAARPGVDGVTGKIQYKNGLLAISNTDEELKMEAEPHPDFWQNNYYHNPRIFSAGFLLLRKTADVKLASVEPMLNILYCPQAIAFVQHHKENFRRLCLKTSFRDESKKSILLVNANIPAFDRDSGSNMITERIRILCKYYTVYLFADTRYHHHGSKYVLLLQELGCRIIYGHEMQPAVQFELSGVLKLKFDYVWVIGLGLMEKYFELIKQLAPQSKLIYDTIDIHFLRLEREEKILQKTNPELPALKQKELLYLKNSDVSFVVSTYEQQYLSDHYQLPSQLLSNIHRPRNLALKPMQQTADLLFIGGFKHEPNIDAVKWLRQDIMPLIWKVNPGLKVHIIGTYPTTEIQQLHADNFIIHGFVEDIEPYFTGCRLFVCPLRYGAGVKGKIGQALEFSLPIVTTAIGAEGMSMEHEKHCLIADDALSFADAVTRLYHDEVLWQRCRSNSGQVLQQFSPEAAENRIKEILDQ